MDVSGYDNSLQFDKQISKTQIKNVAPTNMADGYMIWLYNNSAGHHVDT